MSQFISQFRTSLLHLKDNFPRVAHLNIAAGLACGFVIGVPPMLIHFQSLLSDCTTAGSNQEACSSIHTSSGCNWDKIHSTCLGSQTVCEPTWSEKQCSAASLCTYSSARSQCEQTRGFGWSNSALGFFASANVIGAVLGTLVASVVPSDRKHEQTRRLNQAGALVCFGMFISWLAWMISQHQSVFFLSVGVSISGFAMGIFMSLAPAVVSSVVAPSMRTICGILFQFAITVGILVAATIALIFSGAHSFAPHALYVVAAVSGGCCYYVSEKIAAPIIADFFSAATASGGGGGGGGSGSAAATSIFGSSSGSSGGVGGTTSAIGASGGGSDASDVVLGADHDHDEDAETTSMVIRQQQNEMLPPQTIEGAPPGIRDSTAPPSPANSSGSDLTSSPGSNNNSNSFNQQQHHGGISNNHHNNQQQQQQQQVSKRRGEFTRNCYIAGCFLAGGLQLTGINAVMSYAPKITQAAGVSSPLAGNFLIMLFNSLSCLPAIAFTAPPSNNNNNSDSTSSSSSSSSSSLDRNNNNNSSNQQQQQVPSQSSSSSSSPVYTPSFMYLSGLTGASISCFAAAISMALNSAFLALLSVCAFLLFFESCLGTFYYSLLTEIFEPSIRTTGAGRTNLVNFVSNILVVFLYPSICEWFIPSGGEYSAGVLRVFILFGCLGIVCLVGCQYMFPKTYLKLKEKLETPPSESIDPLSSGISVPSAAASSSGVAAVGGGLPSSSSSGVASTTPMSLDD